ncbi:MAG: aspartate--tRNA ligase [Candidatus Saccharibacteria bacterium]|nr:aspartate--tRNA ligase [Candidatus Saccharibacteria bacterium]
MRTLSGQLKSQLNQIVTLSGWVNSRRDHGGLIFIDLRDQDGLVQLVITPDTADAFQIAETLRDEFVITITGLVRERAPELKNPHIATGHLEVVVQSLTLLNRSEPLPVNTHDDGPESSEELRLKYRYLDLRRPFMQQILKRRASFYKFIRDFMESAEFIEIATPILANSSPEGARDFLVPSRLHPGKFYALPQAPQQFKQLLMVGGVPRYYQIAACFRDEDPRADRLYGDFYQLDLEMSFVEDGETVRSTMEPLIKALVTEFAGKELINSEIPRISYQDALNRYGTDKPDLRYGMELIDLTSALSQTDFKVFQAPAVKAICVKQAATLTRSQIDQFTDLAKKFGAKGLAYLFYEQGSARGPIAKFLKPAELATIQALTAAEDGDAVFFAADELDKVNKILGQLRIAFADHFKLKDDHKIALCWIVDFPFYEWNESEYKLDFGHNPFSMPKGGLDALNSAQTDAQRLQILADQYDMVMNGYEICSGAVRNYNPEVMYQVFAALGYDRNYVQQRFGGMLNAFKFGAPPHAGCAFGLDRIFMVLNDLKNIRDIVAFPKNGSGIDLMMDSPSPVDPAQLTEASIAILSQE